MCAHASANTATLANFPNSMMYAVQSDATGNLYIAGFQGNFTKANPFVARLSATGQTLYSATLAGSGFGLAWAIAIDSSGAAYVFGNTNSSDFPEAKTSSPPPATVGSFFQTPKSPAAATAIAATRRPATIISATVRRIRSPISVPT
jgi:hypothetical protein